MKAFADSTELEALLSSSLLPWIAERVSLNQKVKYQTIFR